MPHSNTVTDHQLQCSLLIYTMRRRRTNLQVFAELVQPMNTAQIFRESIRVLLLHPTHFHFISIFLFSPLPLSLFLSHFLIHQLPGIPSSTLRIVKQLFGQNGGQSPHVVEIILSRTIVHMTFCLPSFITFSLLGRAATVQAVSDSYNGVSLNRRRLIIRSGFTWVKLLHTSFCEFLILLSLLGVLAVSLAIVPKILSGCRFWVVLLVLSVPFSVGFAHTMVVGNLARVVTVLDSSECSGVESLKKAKNLIEGRRQTALALALLSNMGLRLVEFLFEYRMSKEGLGIWEGLMLVSMYSFLLVFDTVMNAVLYHTCKP